MMASKNRTGSVSRRHVFPGDLCTYGGLPALVIAVKRNVIVTNNITVWGTPPRWQSDSTPKLMHLQRYELKLEVRLA